MPKVYNYRNIFSFLFLLINNQTKSIEKYSNRVVDPAWRSPPPFYHSSKTMINMWNVPSKHGLAYSILYQVTRRNKQCNTINFKIKMKNNFRYRAIWAELYGTVGCGQTGAQFCIRSRIPLRTQKIAQSSTRKSATIRSLENPPVQLCVVYRQLN